MGTSAESGGKRKGTGEEEKETRMLQGRGRDEHSKAEGRVEEKNNLRHGERYGKRGIGEEEDVCDDMAIERIMPLKKCKHITYMTRIP
jgi:hypothetical protein